MSRLRTLVLPLLLLGSAAGSAVASDLPPVLAKVGETTITRDEVLQQAATQLIKVRQEEYEILNEAINGLIEKQLVDAAAAKDKKPPVDWLRERISRKLAPPTEAEIQKTYEQYKSRLQGMTIEQARPQIVAFLEQQQSQRVYTELIAELRATTPVSILLEPPRVKVGEGKNPSRGPEGAPVTIIEFSDYECPFCTRAEPVVKQVLQTYGDKVRLVFRDYPLPSHRNAMRAAEAAGCAFEQGKFWEYHEKLFANQGKLDSESLGKYAGEVGLDPAKFKECMDSGRRATEVGLDKAEAEMAGVRGTPAFFVNGVFLNGAQPFEAFKKVIDAELARKGIAPTTAAPASVQPAAAGSGNVKK